MTHAGLDLGSRFLGLAALDADHSRATGATVDIDPGGALRDLPDGAREPVLVPLLAAALERVMVWLAQVEARTLTIELGPFWPGRFKGAPTPNAIESWTAAILAKRKAYAVMERIAIAVEAECAALVPPIATRRIPRATWCRLIGAEADRNAAGQPIGVNDHAVRAALVKRLGEPAVSVLPDVHTRDAMGTLLGGLLDVAPAETGGRRRGRRDEQAHRKAGALRRAKASYARKREREGIRGIAPMAQRLEAALAAGPLRAGDLLHALGRANDAGDLARYVAAGALVRVDMPRKPGEKRRGRNAPGYALAAAPKDEPIRRTG